MANENPSWGYSRLATEAANAADERQDDVRQHRHLEQTDVGFSEELERRGDLAQKEAAQDARREGDEEPSGQT